MKKYPKGVLLFGSTGYLGPKLTETLISDGLNVYTVNRSTPTIKTIKDLTFPDFTQEYNSLVNLIKEEGIDTIVNLTWKGSYGDDRFDRELQLSNLKNVEFLIKLSKDLNLGLINFGTVSQLITAADGTTPVSEYGNAKREVSRLLARTFTNASGNKEQSLEIILGNVYGGEDLTNRFVSMTLSKLANDEPLSINSNGEQDFYPTFIKDFTETVSSLIRKGESGVYLLSREVIPMKEFLITAKKVLNSKSVITFGKVIETSPNWVHNEAVKSRFDLEETISLTTKSLQEQEG